MIHFLIGILHSDWSEVKHQNTSPNRSCIKRRLWSLVVSKQNQQLQFLESWRNHLGSEVLPGINKMHQELQRLHLTLVNRKGPILHHDNAQPHVLQLTLQKLSNWAMKLYLTQLNHQTSLHPTTTCSSISKTSCKRSSTTKQQLKTPSKNSLVPGLQNSILLE
jgi:hypothetical protein